MYKFSIIIPHRNIPSLLRRCLDSIPHRDDVQIIVVDDNSDADKVDFSKFPGLNEKNTEVYFTKEGKGAGYARNVGLKHAKGEWLLFADADDMFMKEVDLVLEHVCHSASDIIFFLSKALNAKNLSPVKSQSYVSYINELLREYENTPNQIRGLVQVPWGKVIRSNFLSKNNILFEETKYANDVRFSAYSDYYAKVVEIFPVEAYCYMVRSDSLWHNRNLEWAKVRFGVSLRIAKFYKKRDIYKQRMEFTNTALFFLYRIKEFSLFHFYIALIRYVLFTGIKKEYINSAIKKIKRKFFRCK